MVKFSWNRHFLALQVHISKTFYCIKTKPSPECFQFHPEEFISFARRSEQNDVLFRCLGRIVVMCSIPEGNYVTLTRKIARAQTEWKALNVIWNGNKNLDRSIWTMIHKFGFKTLRNRLFGHYRLLWVSQGQWPRMTFERSRYIIKDPLWSCSDLNHALYLQSSQW